MGPIETEANFFEFLAEVKEKIVAYNFTSPRHPTPSHHHPCLNSICFSHVQSSPMDYFDNEEDALIIHWASLDGVKEARDGRG